MHGGSSDNKNLKHLIEFTPTPVSPGTSSPGRITKNIYILCLIFFFEFSAFQGLANLQSSINCEGGLGVISLATTYAALMVSSFFLPSFMMNKIGPKWTILICIIGYVIYSAANYFPTYYTLIPASIIMGAAGAPLLTAQAAYVTTCGYALAERNRENRKGEFNPETLVAKFFGIFFFFFEVTQISGNAISTIVLTVGDDNSTLPMPNATLSDETRDYIDANCGANVINTEESEECPEPPEDSVRFILISVYVALGLIAIALSFFLLDNIKIRTDLEETSPKKLVLNTARHAWTDRKQQLLIALTMYSGFKQAFLAADLTQGYIGDGL